VDAEILAAFLVADPSDWPVLAPKVVEAVGGQRLRAIVDGTRQRIGISVRVSDSPQGLVVAGSTGRVLAWVRTDAGRLDALLIAPYRFTRRTAERTGSLPLFRLLWLAFGLWLAVSAWTASTRDGWIGVLLLTLAGYVYFEGMGAPAIHPWWFRRGVQVLTVAAATSAVRWSELASGRGVWTVWGTTVLILVTAVLVRGRRHRWGVSSARPLGRFPLLGPWCVVQGGGRFLNHHFAVPAQRGAIDVVKVGRQGTKSGVGNSLDSFLSYGQDVMAPADGMVTTAVDGLPDQIPGTIRFAPVYGNHVIIDTGSETILLAHLRPGTVAVAVGDPVRSGQLLGQVGNSGNSTTPHLHLQVERDGAGLDLRFTGLPGSLYRGRTVVG